MAKKLNWKYAIGEIIIVSIGILIAFSINTFSSNLASNKKHREYRESLIIDIEDNLKNINRIIDQQHLKVQELEVMMNNLENKSFKTDSICNILYRQRKSPTFFPVSGTFKALVSQGEFGSFSTDLKRELFNLYDAVYQRTEYNGKLYDKIYVETYDKEIHRILNIRTKQIEDFDRLQSPEFKKNISLIIDEAKSYLSLLEKCKKESKKIVELVKDDEG